MICPKCQREVEMLKFTDTGIMCRDCHASVISVPAVSLTANVYRPPLGLPFYWGDDVTGRLPAAMRHYFEFCLGHAPDATAADLGIPPLNAAELKLLCDYCRHFINAPCWENNLSAQDCEDMLADLIQLRARARTLASVESIRRWNQECMELGLDPF
jgi:hypothetical protein